MNLAKPGSDHGADQRSRPAFTWHSPIAARSRLALAPALAIIVALGCPAPGRAAGMVISAPVITTGAGASGSFLVLLTDTDPAGSNPYNATGDQFELTLTGKAAITFTAVTTATDVSPFNTPYLYAYSTDNDYSIPLYTAQTNPFPTTDFTAADTFDVAKSHGLHDAESRRCLRAGRRLVHDPAPRLRLEGQGTRSGSSRRIPC